MSESISNEESSDFEKRLWKSIKNAFSKHGLLKHDGTPPDVQVTYLSIKKGFVVVDVKCQEALERVRAAIQSVSVSSKTGRKFTINTESLIFADPVGAAIASEIYKQQHVTDQAADRNIDLDKHYVRLRLLDLKNIYAIKSENIQMNTDKGRPDYYQLYLEKCGGKDIEEEELVTENEKAKCILLRGRAGIGKSTTVQQLFWRWAHGDWGKPFKALFLLNIRYFLHIRSKVELWQLLSMSSVYAPRNVDPSWLENNEDYLLIVLDGIDEIWNFKELFDVEKSRDDIDAARTPLEWCFSLLQRKCLSLATLLVSSRPFSDLNLIKSSKLVELMGLTRGMVMTFAEMNVKSERVEYVKKALKDNPILLSVSSITYYCSALCKVLEANDLGSNELRTYTQINSYIIEDYVRRCLKQNDGVPVDMGPSLQAISRLAYSGLVKTGPSDLTRLVFSHREYKDLGISESQIDLMCRAGIFTQSKVEDKERPGEEQTLGQFVHLSIQEFLAMTGYLLQDDSAAGDAITEMFRSGQFVMAQMYLFGLVFNTNHKSVKNIVQRLGLRDGQIEQHKEELVNELKISPGLEGLHGMQCVHEAQCEHTAELYADQRVGDKVKFGSTPLTAIDMNALEFTLRHHLSSLTTLDLNNVNLDATTMHTVVGIVNKCQNLKALLLHDRTIDEECLAILEQSWDNSNLQQLYLGYGKVGDEGIASIKNMLVKSTELTTLGLSLIDITETEIQQTLHEFRNLDIFKGFGIHSELLTDEVVKDTAADLQDHHTLDSIGFVSTSITDRGVRHIADLMSTTRKLEYVL